MFVLDTNVVSHLRRPEKADPQVRAWAASVGREYVVPDDIKALAAPVLSHRLVLTPDAELGGLTAEQLLTDVLTSIPIPTGR